MYTDLTVIRYGLFRKNKLNFVVLQQGLQLYFLVPKIRMKRRLAGRGNARGEGGE
jgi:hypothetical protein